MMNGEVLPSNGTLQVPVKIVGSSKFGLYPIISAERTYNMFVSDGWLVNFSGYEAAVEVLDEAKGRGIFRSVQGNFILAVAGANVYRINLNGLSLVPIYVGTIGTSSGEVFIDENLNSQISIVATPEWWIYNYETGSFAQPTFSADLTPTYVSCLNGQFLLGNSQNYFWFVYAPDPMSDIEQTLVTTRTIGTITDLPKAVITIPGSSTNVLVLGDVSGEIWSNVGNIDAFNKNTSVSLYYGTISVSTIAINDNLVFFLASNAQSAPALMKMNGGMPERVSTDGIDNLLENIKHPEQSTAMFYRQSGHLFYQLTFYNAEDNITIAYDVNLDAFYDLTDWNFSYHPARSMVYFNNTNYFISLNDGFLYKIANDITVYEQNPGKIYEIPRVRICDTFRYPNRPEKFLVNLFTFTLENGTEPYYFPDVCYGFVITEDTDEIIYTEDDQPIMLQEGYCESPESRIDISISKNGGRTFGNSVPYYMHNTGKYQCQPRKTNLGAANIFTIQLRFWGFWRFCVSNGTIEVTT